MAIASLPLDLDTQTGLQAFLQAIDDPAARANIRTASLPQGATELIQMVDDPLIQNAAVDLGKRTLKYRHDISTGIGAPDPAFTKQLEADGANLKNQLETKYPEGMALLANYSKMQQHNLLARPADYGTFAANAYVVANAAVYVNAAVATNVAIAAEAVAVAAIVVT